jgi:hypothetical protein
VQRADILIDHGVGLVGASTACLSGKAGELLIVGAELRGTSGLCGSAYLFAVKLFGNLLMEVNTGARLDLSTITSSHGTRWVWCVRVNDFEIAESFVVHTTAVLVEG